MTDLTYGFFPFPHKVHKTDGNTYDFIIEPSLKGTIKYSEQVLSLFCMVLIAKSRKTLTLMKSANPKNNIIEAMKELVLNSNLPCGSLLLPQKMANELLGMDANKAVDITRDAKEHQILGVRAICLPDYILPANRIIALPLVDFLPEVNIYEHISAEDNIRVYVNTPQEFVDKVVVAILE